MDDDSGWRTTPDSSAVWTSDISREIKKRRKNGNYSVGYARPPKDTRWKPGQSGNPRGRPKKIERAATERQRLRDVLNTFEREVSITIEGKRKTMSVIEAIYAQVALQAAKGNHKFLAKALDMHGQAIQAAAILNPNAVRALENVEQHLAGVEETDRNHPQFIDEINKLKRRTRKV